MGLRDLFRGKTTDSVQRDQLVIDALREHGVDLSKERDTRFYLYFPTKDAAETVARELRGGGFAVEVRRSAADDDTWLALASRDMVVGQAPIAAARVLFERRAAEGGGEYDGWEAAAAD